MKNFLKVSVKLALGTVIGVALAKEVTHCCKSHHDKNCDGGCTL